MYEQVTEQQNEPVHSPQVARRKGEPLAERQSRLVLALRGSLAPQKANAVFAELWSTLRPITVQLVSRVQGRKGSLQVDDLVQVIAIEAHKAVPHYDVESRQSFGEFLYFRALRQLNEQIRLHASDVHLSDGAARGRTVKQAQGTVIEAVRCESTTPSEPGALTTGAAAQIEAVQQRYVGQVESETPESLLVDARLRAALHKSVTHLPPVERDLVERVFGLGRVDQSVREVVDSWNQSGWPVRADCKPWNRSGVDRMLAKVLERVRVELRRHA